MIKFFGIVLNQNRLAVLLGVAMILAGTGIFYLLQKHLFGRYQRQVPNSARKTRRE